MTLIGLIAFGLFLAACGAFAVLDTWHRRRAWRRADEEARRRLGLDDQARRYEARLRESNDAALKVLREKGRDDPEAE